MIDSHCHLTYPQLFGQLTDVLARAQAAGVTRLITIGTDIADARKTINLCNEHPQVRCAVGIHPHHSGEATDADLAALAELEREPVVIALGEMGLDYHHDFAPRDRQYAVFTHQLNLAQERKRSIVIHCRQAVDDCLAILKDFAEIPAVFHCFTGSRDEARRILDLGYYMGFTGVATYKRSDELREVIGFVPQDRLLVETDSPYLSPEPVRKQRNCEPAFVMHTAAVVAAVRGITIDELDRLTTANVARLFSWPAPD